jgi:F420-dependent oxidoreductase-like protein
MRIGLSGGGTSVDRIVEQAQDAERDGFTSLWYASAVSGDPLVAMATAGRATTTIELGTAVLQTYPCHPLLMANRAASVASAMGRPGMTLGIGPSHAPVIEGVYGVGYDRPGLHTEEYTRVVVSALRGEAVAFDGELITAHGTGGVSAPDTPIPVLLGALAPRLLRVAGEVADGTVTWMANARAVAEHVSPRLRSAAGTRDTRIVVGLPVAVHDDVDEARAVAATQFAMYGALPNYRRILDIGRAAGPADAAIVGDEKEVERQITAVFDAGATDLWAAPFVVGDRQASRARTRALLAALAGS